MSGANPSDRYADAGQLGSDIDRLLQGLELQAHPLNWIGKARSWCCRPTRLLQAGNLSIAIGAIMAPFHFIATCLGIARSLGAPIPGFEHLRLREFIPLMASFLLYDAWLLLGGFMMRRNRVWAIWLNIAIVIGLLSWFILVLLGIVKFDTGGAVSSMAVRLPIYVVFSGIRCGRLVYSLSGDQRPLRPSVSRRSFAWRPDRLDDPNCSEVEHHRRTDQIPCAKLLPYLRQRIVLIRHLKQTGLRHGNADTHAR